VKIPCGIIVFTWKQKPSENLPKSLTPPLRILSSGIVFM
jgi:hypothetical protein